MIEITVERESIQLVVGEDAGLHRPNFSLVQSNIFYLLYFFNSLVPFAIDFSFQFYRNQRLSDSAQYLIILFAINGFLWLDFNLQILFEKQPPQASVIPCMGAIHSWASQAKPRQRMALQKNASLKW